ncbi:hypothetical protein F1C76_03880 [Geodermatophilaceae bacterium NBWT11]|nr:hypothetical protein F1C76_03880 [Geodermatophilaceae bacterium NBWT11]
MPPTPACPPRLRATVFRGSEAVARGDLTRAQLRSRAFHRLFRDVHAGPDVVRTHQLRTEAAARLLLPGAVATGRSAAVLWGVDLAGPDDDVELTLPPGCTSGRVQGIQVRRRSLPPTDVVVRHRVPVTSLLRTGLDLAVAAPRDEAVVLVDRFLAGVPVTASELLAAAAADAARGARQAEVVVRLADGLAGSPQETLLRLLLHRSRLPRPVAQFRVVHGRREVARVDFGWPEQRVAVEYDGLWHGDPTQFRRDRARLNRLTAAGWRVVFVTAGDLRNPKALIARIERELRRSM